MSEEKEIICKCPLCDGGLIKTGKVIQCNTNKSEKQDDGTWVQTEGCGFKTFAAVCGHELTSEEITKLVAGETIHLNDLKSKKGHEFDCDIKLKDKPDNEFYRSEFLFHNKE